MNRASEGREVRVIDRILCVHVRRIHTPTNTTRKRRATWGQMVLKAYANLALGAGDDCEACLAVDVLLGE